MAILAWAPFDEALGDQVHAENASWALVVGLSLLTEQDRGAAFYITLLANVGAM